jgi:hypothetical protein
MTGEDEGWEASKPTTAPWKSKSMARSTCCCCLVWVRLSHSFGRNYWHWRGGPPRDTSSAPPSCFASWYEPRGLVWLPALERRGRNR